MLNTDKQRLLIRKIPFPPPTAREWVRGMVLKLNSFNMFVFLLQETITLRGMIYIYIFFFFRQILNQLDSFKARAATNNKDSTEVNVLWNCCVWLFNMSPKVSLDSECAQCYLWNEDVVFTNFIATYNFCLAVLVLFVFITS